MLKFFWCVALTTSWGTEKFEFFYLIKIEKCGRIKYFNLLYEKQYT